MSKRQLSIKYKDLVDYVNEQKPEKTLVKILDDSTRQAKDCYNPGSKLWRILEELYTTCLSDNEIIDLVETIIDIYNSNYELEETKHYWKLNMFGIGGNKLYAFKFYLPDRTVGIVSEDDVLTAGKFTRNELTEMLANTDTNLTIDNFDPVEDLDE
ncbi:hypothetical protein D1B17_08720 [Companilactobacillus zhachilii]|uniref:Uncharacterized protein n=1 Tax=Companilactobacillus zhachilii TaxID=2304606 RepID=A0A386PW74_9LACO|nr:hypothetical protein [Companilactobacillus zhachilii]AYE38707.1 hypothetical protein D1B17_08720 [Companilactobacillus zhachilii]